MRRSDAAKLEIRPVDGGGGPVTHIEPRRPRKSSAPADCQQPDAAGGRATRSTMSHAAARADASSSDVEELEVGLLVEALFRHYGYDFREYAGASLKRRIVTFAGDEGLTTISAVQDRVLHDPAAVRRLLYALTVNVTAVFRDPDFFLAFRQLVVPHLRTYPFVRIWHAGCSTGEEVYSMAILLQEEGVYDKCRIYATDMDDSVLRQAKEGIFPLESTERYVANYRAAGGLRDLSDYYTGAYGHGLFRSSLRNNVVFSQHNLATDRSFNEFHVILCRNVMIYFTQPLQNRVHELFFDSLVPFGILGVGSKETLQFTPHEKDYEQLQPGIKLFRRSR